MDIPIMDILAMNIAWDFLKFENEYIYSNYFGIEIMMNKKNAYINISKYIRCYNDHNNMNLSYNKWKKKNKGTILSLNKQIVDNKIYLIYKKYKLFLSTDREETEIINYENSIKKQLMILIGTKIIRNMNVH